MKLRNLFLASLATVAMASCSNEENAFNNEGTETTKDAIVQFGITFSGTLSRATDATDGGKEAGTAEEQAFSDATIVIKQGTKKNIVTVPFTDFTSVTEGGEHDPVTLWLKEKISVTEGEASVWVFLNASSALQTSLATATDFKTLTESVAFSAGINALEATGKIAEANHFLMSNETGDATTTRFNKGEINTLKVCVSRVASKLEELTPADNSYNVGDNAENLAGKTLKVKLTDFAYAGLEQQVAVLKGGTITSSLYKPYGSITDFEYQPIAATATKNYCMENLGGTSKETTTNVIYKGEISVDGEVSTLYITADNKAYTSIEALREDGFTFEGLTEDTSIQDCWDNYALRKYENGVCYYVGQIKTAATQATTIVRNNIYRLSVNSISGLGTTLPKNFDDPTLLDLTVEIDPWTVNLNSFDL